MEFTFNIMCGEVMQEYKDKAELYNYIEGGWCGRISVWRKLEPKCQRLFEYGHVDTTNLVKRHWQFIKYTRFEGRINSSIVNLVHALI